jgi:hypothetical protein
MDKGNSKALVKPLKVYAEDGMQKCGLLVAIAKATIFYRGETIEPDYRRSSPTV